MTSGVPYNQQFGFTIQRSVKDRNIDTVLTPHFCSLYTNMSVRDSDSSLRCTFVTWAVFCWCSSMPMLHTDAASRLHARATYSTALCGSSRGGEVVQTDAWILIIHLFWWFQIFALFWMLYSFFWVIYRLLKYMRHRFGTFCLFHLHGCCKQGEPIQTKPT